jgi:hypothetical protein
VAVTVDPVLGFIVGGVAAGVAIIRAVEFMYRLIR